MPRIEIVPNPERPEDRRSSFDGSDTVDVCVRCSHRFELGLEPDGDLKLELMGIIPGFVAYSHLAVVSSDDVAHPPYDDQPDPYFCALCGEQLNSNDD